MFNERKFKSALILNGVTVDDLAETLGVNKSTVYRKIERNGDFSRDEISKIMRVLNLSDPCDIFFDDELA